MIKDVARIQKELSHVEGPTISKNSDVPGSRSNNVFDPTLNEVIRREQQQEILNKFKKKIKYVERYSLCIEDDRELAVLNCLLDGMNINMISHHMSYSKRTIYSIKESLVKKIKEFAEKDEKYK